ncbi:hypothetical protein EIK77_007775 [Talaromyces pinophilus]|nr:hypothetical protein EIK77_007775 [Talaromyces pinophilus]PCG96746.1 DNA glycosylase [Penicillium occitanis (nom. inval.)]PCG97067.1 hypothetical protein PENOC_069730 [Penicillium occitanis (nom. inval.)]
MPNRNVTTIKRTAKTSSYFVRSRGNNRKSGDGDLSKTWAQVKRRNSKSDEKKVIPICASGKELLSAIDDAGSSSCQDVSVLTQTRTCDLVLTAQTELQNRTARAESEVYEDHEHAVTTSSASDIQALAEQLLLQPIDAAEIAQRGDTDDDNTNPEAEIPSQIPPQNPEDQPQKRPRSSSPRKQPPKLSPYFPKPLPLIETSCLPFPPISAPTFGLIQEQLSLSPFRLLIATIFLNRTRGPVAIPVLFKLFELYPTIEDMARATHDDIVSIIRGLGFQNQRATKFIALAQKWLESPPERGKRYRKLNYPLKRDGADVAPDEVVPDEADYEVDGQKCDTRVAWEIAHLPGVGAYAIDSWRIFCRDHLRFGPSPSTTSDDSYYEPEWKRVLPQDKELRAYLSWKWLQEGWVWNCENGSRTKADAEMMKRAEKGGVAFEGGDGHLVVMNIQASSSGVHGLQDIKKAGFSLDCS